MTSRNAIASFLLAAFITATAFAADVPSPSRGIDKDRAQELVNLELRFRATAIPSERKQVVDELKSLCGTRNPATCNAEESRALNAAVVSLLPESDSSAVARQLLEIAAAHPVTEANTGNLPKDKAYLVDVRSTARTAKKNNADVEALADIRVDHLRKDSLGHDGLALAHMQQIWRINTVQGARSFSPRTLMYAAMSERLYVVRARAIKRNGQEQAATISADQPIIEQGSSMFFDSLTRDLQFKQLEPGDLVEVEYYLLPATDINPWSGYYARLDLFRDSFPTRLRRRVVIAPSSMKLYAVTHGIGKAEVRQGSEETTRIWEARNIDAQPFEPFSPGSSTTGPYLHVSTIGSIEEFGHWYNRLLEPGLALDDNLKSVAQGILERNLTPYEKVQAVYEAVQRRTKYVAFEFGVRSYQPYPVARVDQRGFGDCKDKAGMLVALLRAVGVPAEFAMVRTRSAGEVAADAYSVQMFNHAVAYVPSLNLFLDGTAEYAALGELPPDDQGAIAMTVDAEGKATRRIVPFSSPENNRVTREVRARLDSKGQVEFQSQTKFSGYYAAEQRRNSESNDLAGNYRATLAQFYPTVKIAHAAAEGTARASREVDLKIEGSIDAAHGEHEVSLRSSLNTAGLLKKYAQEKTRRSPELVPVMPSEREVFEYDLPQGAKAVLPANTKLDSPFGKVEISYHLDGDKLEVETYTELVPQTVASADYGAFRAFCRTADEALQRDVRIVLP